MRKVKVSLFIVAFAMLIIAFGLFREVNSIVGIAGMVIAAVLFSFAFASNGPKTSTGDDHLK